MNELGGFLFCLWYIIGAISGMMLVIEGHFKNMPIYKKVIALIFSGPLGWATCPFYFIYKWLSHNNDN